MAVSRKRLLARVFFLSVTALALITECWFAWDGDPDTDPWTDLIGDYVPWQVALAVFGALLLWVPAHFWQRYKREHAERLAEQASRAQVQRSLAKANEIIQKKNNLIDDLLREQGYSPGKIDTNTDDSTDTGQPPGQGTLF